MQRAALLALAILSIAGLAGCGGSNGSTGGSGTTTTAVDPEDLAGQIESRLRDAGYTVGGLTPGLHLTPKPVKGFRVQADYASAHSYTVTVLVFRTAAQARRFERIYEEQCAQVPDCKKLGDARRGKVVDNVVYSALSDDGKTALDEKRFAKF